MPEVWFPNLDIKIDKLPRVAFSVFGVSIYWYAVIIATGVGVGLFLAMKEAKRTGQNPEDYYDYLLVAFILAIIGARLYYVIFTWDSFKNDLIRIFNTRSGGLAIYGGIIGAVIAAVFFTKKRNINLLLFLDTCAPSLVLGQAIGRWGNFFNREVFGGYTDSLFAMRYLIEQVDIIPKEVLEKAILIEGIPTYIQVQPTFLYESIWNVGVFIVLFIMSRHKKFNGEIVALYFLLYGIGRAWIEGIRTDQLYLFNTNIPVSQLLSILMAVCSLIFIIIMRKRSGGVKNSSI